jgi:F0F1-type ATP synthase gamma subunit
VSSYLTHIIIDQNSVITYFTGGYGASTVKTIDKNIEPLSKNKVRVVFCYFVGKTGHRFYLNSSLGMLFFFL